MAPVSAFSLLFRPACTCLRHVAQPSRAPRGRIWAMLLYVHAHRFFAHVVAAPPRRAGRAGGNTFDFLAEPGPWAPFFSLPGERRHMCPSVLRSYQLTHHMRATRQIPGSYPNLEHGVDPQTVPPGSGTVCVHP